MTKLWDVDDLVGVTDIANRLGVGAPAVSNWKNRHEDFPEPVFVLSGTQPVYSWEAVVQWVSDGPQRKLLNNHNNPDNQEVKG